MMALVVLVTVLISIIVKAFSEEVHIEAVTPSIFHSEGPYWSIEEQVLYYVSTFNATVMRWDPKTNIVTQHVLANRDNLAVVIPIKGRKHQFVLASDRYILKFTWDGKQNNTGAVKTLTMIEKDKPKTQFNDGKIDVEGRFWLGTLQRNKDLSIVPNGGRLFVFSGNDINRPKVKINTTTISNGLTWTKDNTKFFFIDSGPKTITEFAFNKETGDISDGSIIFNLNDHPDLEGMPDSMTIDSEDNLWVALFGGHAVLCIDGETGKIKQVVKVPATYVTNVVFGGPNLDILYVTTSRRKLTAEQRNQELHAGSVFAVRNLGIQGFPASEFVL